MDTELITRYVRGLTTDEEDKEILRSLEESPANRALFADIMAIEAADAAEKTTPYDTDRMLDCLNSRIDADARRPSRRWIAWSGWAVAAALLAGIFLFVFRSGSRPEPEPQWTGQVVNTTTNVQPCALDDGTKIYLTPGAAIHYNVSALPGKRLVQLEGEAYFDVAKDPSRPMTVDAGPVRVEVLGTSFSVSNGGHTGNTDVVLERGAVRLLSRDGQKLVNLKPNQKATFLHATSDVVVEEMYAMPYITEKYNLISLMGADISQIVSVIERNYGVKVTWKGGDPDKHFDLNFLKTDSLKDVIDIVEYISGYKLSVSEGIQ